MKHALLLSCTVFSILISAPIQKANAADKVKIAVMVTTENPNWVAPISNCIIERIQAESPDTFQVTNFSDSFIDIYVTTLQARNGNGNQIGISAALAIYSTASKRPLSLSVVSAAPNIKGLRFICDKTAEVFNAYTVNLIHEIQNSQLSDPNLHL